MGMDMQEQLAELVYEELGKLAKQIGPVCASISRFGSVYAQGDASNDAKLSYTIVLATNDASDALREWINEQLKGRSEAAKEAGRDLILTSNAHEVAEAMSTIGQEAT